MDRREIEDRDLIDALLYVRRVDGKSGGWKIDLLASKMEGSTEAILLTCTACRGLLRDASLVQIAGTQELQCSVCIDSSRIGGIVIAQTNRFIINQKHVKCPFHLKGCKWVHLITSVVQHLSSCSLFPTRCPNGCISEGLWGTGKVTRIERGKLPLHLKNDCKMRIVNCDFCTISVKLTEMRLHLNSCEYFLVPCPNSCVGDKGVRQLKRKSVYSHLAEECPNQELDCPYLEYGCNVAMKRKMMDIHEKEQIHTHFKLTMSSVKKGQNEQRIRIAKLEEENAKLKSNLDKAISTINNTKGFLEFNFTGVRGKINNAEKSESDPFYAGLYKCQVYIQWDCEIRGFVGVFISILKGSSDDLLEWPFRYKATIILLNQHNNCENYVMTHEVTDCLIRQFPASFEKPKEPKNYATGMSSFVSHTEILKAKYSDNNTANFKVIVERR